MGGRRRRRVKEEVKKEGKDRSRARTEIARASFLPSPFPLSLRRGRRGRRRGRMRRRRRKKEKGISDDCAELKGYSSTSSSFPSFSSYAMLFSYSKRGTRRASGASPRRVTLTKEAQGREEEKERKVKVGRKKMVRKGFEIHSCAISARHVRSGRCRGLETVIALRQENGSEM